MRQVRQVFGIVAILTMGVGAAACDSGDST